MRPRDLLFICRQTVMEWIADKAPMLGAALAYYTIFSLAPLLLIAIGIAGLFLGEAAARGHILDQLSRLIGEQGGRAIQDIILNASSHRGSGIVASSVGVVTLLFGASGVFGQLQTSLNLIWKVESRARGGGLMGIVKSRFLTFGFVLVVGFLLLVSLILSSVITFLAQWLGEMSRATQIMTQGANVILSFGLITFLFALIFKYLPDTKIAWRDVWLGAAMTSALFTVGKFVVGFYLGTSSVASSFGAAGSLIILLLWVYYSAQILFFGAEFTQVWAKYFASAENRGEIPPMRTTQSPRFDTGRL